MVYVDMIYNTNEKNRESIFVFGLNIQVHLIIYDN